MTKLWVEWCDTQRIEWLIPAQFGGFDFSYMARRFHEPIDLKELDQDYARPCLPEHDGGYYLSSESELEESDDTAYSL